MSETKDSIVERIDTGKVYLDEKGELYFIKRIRTYKFLMMNQNGENVYSKIATDIKTEHVTPEQLGYSKRETWDIYVYKVNHSELEDTTEYYSMTLTFQVPNEKPYLTAYFRKVKSGRVFLKWFNSGTCSEISINDPEWTTRSKAKKLSPDTILQRNAPVFTLSSSGELERRLDSEAVW